MTESEQAISKIRHRVNDWKNHLELNSIELPIATLDCLALLEIVDSQAQKIAEQAKKIERITVMCKQEDAQIIALVKERDEARTVADEWREKAGSKYDPHPWEKQ